MGGGRHQRITHRILVLYASSVSPGRRSTPVVPCIMSLMSLYARPNSANASPTIPYGWAFLNRRSHLSAHWSLAICASVSGTPVEGSTGLFWESMYWSWLCLPGLSASALRRAALGPDAAPKRSLSVRRLGSGLDDPDEGGDCPGPPGILGGGTPELARTEASEER